MPTYVYQCNKCKKVKEVFHSMSEVSLPNEETVIEITCHKKLMKRIPCVPQLMGFEGGTSTSEHSKLMKKQKSLKERSRAHFANDGHKEVKDPELKEYFKKKVKTDPIYTKHKDKDHEKWKTL